MNRTKMALAAVLMAAGTFGLMGTADAATGIVNVNAVLQNNQAFQKAGRELAGEQQKLQNRYNEQSKDMTNDQKAALAKDLNEQLAKKEQALMTPIQEKFKAAVEKAAKDKKVDTIVAPGGLLYGTVDVDLTADVQANMK